MSDPMPAPLRHAIESSPGMGQLRLGAAMGRPGSRLWRATTEVSGRSRRVIVKVAHYLRPEDEEIRGLEARVRGEFDVLRRLRRDLEPWPELRVPEAILCLPEQRALVLEEVEGETLRDLVLSQARLLGSRDGWARIAGGFRAAGRWLGAIQRLDDPSPEPIDFEALRAYDEVRLRRLLEWGSIPARLAERVREESRRLAAQVPEGLPRASVLVHGDYCPSNMLLSGQDIVVIDFTMVERGSIHQDLAYSFEYLERFLNRLRDRPFIRRGVIRDLQEALLDGYRERMPLCEPLFRLNQIRHHLNYFVNQHEPVRGLTRWVALVDRRRARRGLEAWLDGRGVSPAGARP